MVVPGAVTTRPAPPEPKVTVKVALPTNAVTGLMTTLTGVPGPVAVLQVRVTVPGVAVRRFTALAGIDDPTKARTSHKADRLAWSADSFISKILFEYDLQRMLIRS
jgi:Ni,Fe-hydrogenase III small subunit